MKAYLHKNKYDHLHIAQDVNKLIKDIKLGDMSLVQACIVGDEEEKPYFGESVDIMYLLSLIIGLPSLALSAYSSHIFVRVSLYVLISSSIDLIFFFIWSFKL